MIIERVQFNVVRGYGNLSKAADMLAADAKRNGFKGRVLVPNVAPVNTFVEEIEYENFAERERQLGEWIGTPRMEKFFAEFSELIEPGSPHEIWSVRATF